MTVLYISYDGILDPVGQSQILPYVRGLVKRGVSIHLLSFEKTGRLRNKTQLCFHKELMETEYIKWHILVYHKNPIIPATLFDIFVGFLRGWILIKKNKIQILHARGYIAGLIAYFLKISKNTKFIFDTRGFWPEEKVDAAAWQKGAFLHRFFKYLEKKMLFKADEIVVLTEAARKLLQQRYNLKNISVIPCCVDLEFFSQTKNPAPEDILPRERLLVAYLGSVGTFYDFEKTADFFNCIKNAFPKAFFMILSGSNKNYIYQTMGRYRISQDDFIILSVPHNQIPSFLKRCAFTLIFYRRKLSASGCCPIKFAESLACGVPVIISAGIGDCDRIVQQEGLGVVLTEQSPAPYIKAIQEIEDILHKKEDIAQRCRNAAKIYFSLEDGVREYFSIYQKLTE